MAFFSCFASAFTKLFACGTRQRRTNETNTDAPYELTPKREPIVAESLAPVAQENSEETEPDLTEPDRVSIVIKGPRSTRNAADENIVSTAEIKLNVESDTSPEFVRDSLGILADHPFGCPEPESGPQPLLVARAETRLSFGSTSTAESIPQLVEVSTETSVEASTTSSDETPPRTSHNSAAIGSGRGDKIKKRRNQLEKLKEKYRLRVDKAKREWELAQFKADEALRKMRAVGEKAEKALNRMRQKDAEKKRKAEKKKHRAEKSGKPPIPADDSGLGVDQSLSGVEADRNRRNSLGPLPEIPREWGVFHLRRGQRSDASAEEIEITDID